MPIYHRLNKLMMRFLFHVFREKHINELRVWKLAFTVSTNNESI